MFQAAIRDLERTFSFSMKSPSPRIAKSGARMCCKHREKLLDLNFQIQALELEDTSRDIYEIKNFRAILASIQG